MYIEFAHYKIKLLLLLLFGFEITGMISHQIASHSVQYYNYYLSWSMECSVVLQLIIKYLCTNDMHFLSSLPYQFSVFENVGLTSQWIYLNQLH